MNYYQFHLGDYASHTKHLSLFEDLAYRRMIDLYYTSESPLPLEPERIARLIGMRDYLQEVSDVLSDFFLISEDGYRNNRCDKEITKFQEGSEDREQKEANERDRLRRHRERRSAIFNELRIAGVAPAWNVTTTELQRLHKAHCNAPDTRTGSVQNEPDTASQAPDTANQEPLTNNHKPLTNKRLKTKTEPAAPLPIFAGVGLDVLDRFTRIRKDKKQPITEIAMLAIEREAMKCGLSFADALVVCCENTWGSFKQSWYENTLPSSANPRKRIGYESEKDRYNREFFEQLNRGEENEPRIIDINTIEQPA